LLYRRRRFSDDGVALSTEIAPILQTEAWLMLGGFIMMTVVVERARLLRLIKRLQE
jgi:hypothetical protein